ncbi:MAG: DHH family phosphoesterase [Candidatus Thermoplasmatota archaeon]|nr:DHH family phosphoesterase [Candidatus Thermoplasmatota archaeon]MBU1940241.1 DHH family phosphoesterase [Candidatus Thermoplasmatota archaeon]
MFDRAQQLANRIKKAEQIHIVTHIDADGIAAGGIALQTLERLGKDVSIECVKQLDEGVMSRLLQARYQLVWFTDLGSSISTDYPKLTKVITDHHTCSEDSDLPFHLNPHLFGFDGSYDLSGAGTTYLVARAIDAANTDLAGLAIVGACGDLQDRRFCGLRGTNQMVVDEGISAGVLERIMDIRFFGRETRPIVKLLTYASDPIIPGLSRREDACTQFLEDLGIRVREQMEFRRWIDLSSDERHTVLSALFKLLLDKGFGAKYAERILGETYLLSREEPGSELHDAKEFATLLNSTARYGKHDVGLNVCLGDRQVWLDRARNLLRGHRQNLVEGLQVAHDEQITRLNTIQFFHAHSGIRDTIIGIVTNMLLNTEEVDRSLPLLGFAETKEGDIKVSARTTQTLVNQGVNLSAAIKHAAQQVNGVGGGHNIAAGATIPKGAEDAFLGFMDTEIARQLAL